MRYRLPAALLAALVVLSLLPSSLAEGAPSRSAARYVQVVAHPDDDLLFMNPDLLTSVRSGAETTTVYVTAGESDVRPPEPYAAGRQAGSRAAFAAMAGVPDRWDRRVLQPVPGVYAELQVLRGSPSVRLVFLNLPDDNDPVVGRHALRRLWGGERVRSLVPAGSALPADSAYDRRILVDVLAALLRRFDPTALRTQDPEPDPLHQQQWAEHDHPDHLFTARFVRAALRGSAGAARVSHYRDYNVADSPPNLSPEVVAAKRRIFGAYAAHDPMVSLGEPYATWTAGMRYRWPSSGAWAESDRYNDLHFADSGRLGLVRGDEVTFPGSTPAGRAIFTGGPEGELFRLGRAADGIEWSHQRGPRRWSPSRRVPLPGNGKQAGSPAAAVSGDGHLVLAIKDAGGGASVRNVSEVDGMWVELGGAPVSGGVAAVRGSTGDVHVFTVTPTGMLHWRVRGSSRTAEPVPVGLRPSGPLATATGADGAAVVAFRQAGTAELVVLSEQQDGWQRRSVISPGGGSAPALAAPGGSERPVLVVRNGLGGTEIFEFGPSGTRRSVLPGAVADRPVLSADGRVLAVADDGRLLISEPHRGGYGPWRRLPAPARTALPVPSAPNTSVVTAPPVETPESTFSSVVRPSRRPAARRSRGGRALAAPGTPLLDAPVPEMSREPRTPRRTGAVEISKPMLIRLDQVRAVLARRVGRPRRSQRARAGPASRTPDSRIDSNRSPLELTAQGSTAESRPDRRPCSRASVPTAPPRWRRRCWPMSRRR